MYITITTLKKHFSRLFILKDVLSAHEAALLKDIKN
jgi:hypothetical protein